MLDKNELHDVFLHELAKLKLRFPVADLSKSTSYNHGNISEFVNSKKTVTIGFFKAFCTAYGLDYDMLANGEVEPSAPKEVIPLGKHPHSKLKPSDYKSAFSDWEGLPMYNMPITASFIASYRDDQQLVPQYYFYDPRFRDCDFGAIITGDSMHSEIRHGDFIACKEITDIDFIVFGDIYYVVATNGLETCKYLNADPNSPNNFLLVPRNEKISPSPISKEKILKLYKVRGIVRGY